MGEDALAKVIAAIIAIPLVIVFAFIFGWVLMILWNYTMPYIFGLPTLTYWKGVAIYVLAKMFFGKL